MQNVTRGHLVAAFEELIAEDQIQTAVDLLVSADPDEQLETIEQSSPALLHSLFQALDDDDRLEVASRLSDQARARLREALMSRIERAEGTEPDAKSDDGFLDRQSLDEMFKLLPVESARPPVVDEPVVTPIAGRSDFALVDGRLRESTPDEAVVTVYSDPSGPAQRDLVELLGIDEHTLASALDPDEISRLEYDKEENRVFIVWKLPSPETTALPELLGLASIGMFLQRGHLTIVTPGEAPLLRPGDKAASPQEVMLRVLAATVNDFLVELKAVKRTSREIQGELSKSIENRQLLRMFNLSEGLVYHINAIDANEGVLRKLRTVAPRIGFAERDMELLDDIIIDNTQCSRQGQVFSTVLAGMLDARGNLINNNMNVLLKNLTIINVVLLPLAVITGILGSSEFTMMIDHYSIDWRAAYPLYLAGLLGISGALWFAVRAYTNRTWSR